MFRGEYNLLHGLSLNNESNLWFSVRVSNSSVPLKSLPRGFTIQQYIAHMDRHVVAELRESAIERRKQKQAERERLLLLQNRRARMRGRPRSRIPQLGKLCVH